ncbi:MAG: hypothetical protein J5518_09625 [Lachnospiraceae bacterium]|nr:hypothetical protein [Lachnospiraceae bacterium]
MKGILREGCSIKPDKFKNDGSMSGRVNDQLKKKIIQYLQTPKPGTVGMMPMIDPVTKEVYSRENIIRDSDGYQWSSGVTYMFDKYDILLSDEFMSFMEDRFGLKR